MDTDYMEIVQPLEVEWPEARLRKYILDYLRESCAWAQERKQELELDNRDARALGVSYKQRQTYTHKIHALDLLFSKWRARGIEYSKRPVKVSDLVRPEDLSYIQRLGFEWHLRGAIIW